MIAGLLDVHALTQSSHSHFLPYTGVEPRWLQPRVCRGIR